MENYLKVVVTGEVDSGKSTLIGRFLFETGSLSQAVIEDIQSASRELGRDFEFAYLLDSFEEERRNQLTLDTTEAFCKTKIGKGIIFIDVPGHKELLKNMLCGSSYADIAILVIDVQKSMEEGTKRHINILKFLGIDKIILALNKIDLANFSEYIFNKVAQEIIKFSKETKIQFRYIIPLSAKQGDNLIRNSSEMLWYKGKSLIEALRALNKVFKKENGHDFCFPVQDVYSTNGKSICVGNIISGRIKKGEIVKILPLNKESRVKEIKEFNKVKSQAKAPESIGLVLSKIDDLQRGQIVCSGKTPEVTTQIFAKIFCLQPLNLEQNLLFKCTTQETQAKIKKINKVFDSTGLEVFGVTNNLRETNAAEVSIITEKPIVIKNFLQLNSLGKFVLQDNREILAVGIIPQD